MQFFIDFTTVIANIGIAIGIVFAMLQFLKTRENNQIQKDAIKQDHERRCKHATLEYYRVLRELLDPSIDLVIEKKQTQRTIDPISMSQILADDDIHEAIKQYLGGMESLAIGVNTDIYDMELIWRLDRFRLIEEYTILLNYINALDDGETYEEYKTFLHELQVFDKEQLKKRSK